MTHWITCNAGLIFKGAHVTIHARCEDDIDEDDIIKKVSKSSGANYGFHKEKVRPEFSNAPSGPVVSVYEFMSNLNCIISKFELIHWSHD